MSQEPRRTGRPAKAAEPGTRVSLGLKVTSQVKARLDGAARLNGRTQSQEAELRLEMSFRDEGILPQIMALAYGRQTAGLLMLVGACISKIGGHAAFAETHTLEAVDNWMMRPWAFQQVESAIVEILNALRPHDDVVVPGYIQSEAIPKDVREALQSFGKQFVATYLQALVDPVSANSGDILDDMQPVRERLAEVVQSLKASRYDGR
jgi:hypothetical protein